MRLSGDGKSVYLEVGFWLDKNDSIHLTGKGVEGFHVAINGNPKSTFGHPKLYERLAKCLARMGAPAPAIEEGEPDA